MNARSRENGERRKRGSMRKKRVCEAGPVTMTSRAY